MGWQGRRRSLAIVGFSALLAAVAVLLLVGPLQDVQAMVPGMPWWLLLPAFTLAELVVVHVQARRESLSVSFREVPLVLGLVFLSPAGLVAASVLGSLVGLLRRRQNGEKLLFNLCLFALEAALASTLYRLAAGGAEATSPQGLLAAVVTVVVTDLLSAAALTTVIWLKVGEFDEGVLGEAVTTGLVAALANTSLGLLVVVLVESRPVALLLLLAVITTLALAYRGYASLSRGHARLEALYRFTRRVQREDSTAGVAEAVLRQARDVLVAETAELLVLSGSGGGMRLVLVDGEVVRTPLLFHRWLGPARDGRAVLRHEPASDTAPRDAMAAPLEVEGTVVAVLVVQDRPHHLGPFTAQDLRLFESLANHASVSLHKSRLVDQLRAEAETQEHLSLHDALTGLPNRRHALRALRTELARTGDTAVLVLDLNGFTDINEAFGSATGDQLLRELGHRLKVLVPEPGHVARLGNDEFVVVLSDVRDVTGATAAAAAVLKVVRPPFSLSGVTVDVRACAGLAISPAHGREAELLLRRADTTMYAAKREGVALRTWDPSTAGDSTRRLTLLRHLRETIEQGALDVHYQPKIDPGTGEVVGAEALARWSHPEHGTVGPDEFIPLAEHSGLVHPLTRLVLDKALAQCALWRADVPAFTVAVNLSAQSLLEPALAEQVQVALLHADVPGNALTIELTETVVMTDVDRGLKVLNELARLGLKLSIDDFGTGQSSLSYLKHLPVHELKVDRSFVGGVSSRPGDAAIVRAAIDLGHTHGLAVVAEGVEDLRTLELLGSWGCDAVQGYVVSRPLPPETFDGWLAERHRRPTLSSARRYIWIPDSEPVPKPKP